MNKVYKRIFVTIISFFLIIFPSYMFVMYKYDPKHIFSNPNNYFSNDMRSQAKTYINANKKVAGIIIGSSMLENTSSYESNKLFFQLDDSKIFLNLSLKGSSFAERKIILDYAFKSRNIEKIIYSLDPAPLHFAPLTEMSWVKIYDNNPLNDLFLYFNQKSLQCLLTASHSSKCYGTKIDLDRPAAWIKDLAYSASFNGVCSWTIQSRTILKNALNSYQNDTAIDAYNLEYQKNYTQDNVFKILDSHRSTNFYFLIPPYSALYFRLQNEYDLNKLTWAKNFLKYFISECDKRKNCHVYGFNDMKFTTDLKNYKDLMHYSDKINSYMLKSIKSETNSLNSTNLNLYFQKMDELNSKVSLDSVKKQLNECM